MRLRVFCLLVFVGSCLLTLCSCDGRTSHTIISAKDPFTETILSLRVPADYSPGDFSASGGCSFSTELEFDDMISIAEQTEEVSSVNVYESFEWYQSYQQAVIFMEEDNGFFSAYYLDHMSFYGMGVQLLESIDRATGVELLFPYYLLGDSRISPQQPFLLEGVEYTCVASDNIIEEFKEFYRLTGHYEINSAQDGFHLVMPFGNISVSFTSHAGQDYVTVVGYE